LLPRWWLQPQPTAGASGKLSDQVGHLPGTPYPAIFRGKPLGKFALTAPSKVQADAETRTIPFAQLHRLLATRKLRPRPVFSRELEVAVSTIERTRWPTLGPFEMPAEPASFLRIPAPPFAFRRRIAKWDWQENMHRFRGRPAVPAFLGGKWGQPRARAWRASLKKAPPCSQGQKIFPNGRHRNGRFFAMLLFPLGRLPPQNVPTKRFFSRSRSPTNASSQRRPA